MRWRSTSCRPSCGPAVADRLVELIRKADTHLGTGFLATPYLLPVLADTGHLDVAYELLLQDSEPSWLVMVDRGATTVWERWNGVSAEGVPHESLNHYSKGAVISFLHRYTAGIELLEPAYRRFRVRPRPGGGLTSAEAAHESPYGRIESAWRLDGDAFELRVVVPAGTEAEVVLPDGTRRRPPAPASTPTPARSPEETSRDEHAETDRVGRPGPLPAPAASRPAATTARCTTPASPTPSPLGYRPLQLDLWVPPTPTPAPLVVWIHGGGWMIGDRRYLPETLRPNQVFDALLDAGLAVATIDYRHALEAPFPAQLHDAKAAIRYLRGPRRRARHLDRRGSASWGESAGGHLAALRRPHRAPPRPRGQRTASSARRARSTSSSTGTARPTSTTMPRRPRRRTIAAQAAAGDARRRRRTSCSRARGRRPAPTPARSPT